MDLELIPEGGKFYKTNFHCHTDLSDGEMTAEEIKNRYLSLGYSAVCFTDHEILVPHSELSDERFIALNGYEVCIKQDLHLSSGFFRPLYHFNLIAGSADHIDMPKFFRDHPSAFGNSVNVRKQATNFIELIDRTEYDRTWINAYLKDVVDRDFLVNYNHPQWSLQTRDDYIGLQNVHSVEVINGGCRYVNDNTSIHFEQMLRAGMRVCPTAGDDNHRMEDTGLAWTMLKAPELSYAALIDAYKKGNCYVSEGPEIYSLVIYNGKIRIRTSSAAAVLLLGEGRYGKLTTFDTEKETETEFEYQPEKTGSYFRLEVRDRYGNRAYTNAYFRNDLEKRARPSA